jgi:cytochrome c peroxidase
VAGIPFRIRFPLAERPILDANGVAYQRGELIKGAYPWISHDGTELFYQASRDGVSGRRSGTSVVGRWTGWTIRHIDGPINRNRHETDKFITEGKRLFISSPGAFTTMWSPYKDVDDLKIPYSVRGPSYPIFGTNSRDYNEVHFDDYLDGNYVLYLGMNEQLNREGTFQPTKTNDTSGNFNNGTLIGAKFPLEYNGQDEIVGRYGQAIYFPSNSFVAITKNKGWDRIKHSVSVDFWVKKLSGNGTIPLFNLQNGIWIALKNGGQLTATVNDVQDQSISIDGDSISNNQWTHVALVLDARQKQLTLYINGRVSSRVTISNFGNVNSSGLLKIGPENASALLLIDEVKVSDVARQTYEIKHNANQVGNRSARSELTAIIPDYFKRLRFNTTDVEGFSLDKVELGETLFNDVLLSKNQTTSCSTCHNPGLSFTDGLAIAKGNEPTDKGERNTPTLFNRLFSSFQGWGGNAQSLDSQAIIPITAVHEMNLPIEEAVARLRDNANYSDWFMQLYGEQPNASNLQHALATFQVAKFSPRTRVDDYLLGNKNALNQTEQQGLALFEGKARCSGCHSGVNFTDESFRNNGVVDNGDRGRGRVTGRNRDHQLFKVPTLRQLAFTAPYMHDGSFATLREVIEAYNQGGNGNPMVDSDIRPLELSSEEIDQLEAFLLALSSPSTGDGDGDGGGDDDDPATDSNTLSQGERLNPNERLESSNGQYRLYFQGDGNLVLRNSSGDALWSTGTHNTDANRVVMQSDGNLVIYGDSGAHWASGTNGSGANRLTLHNDGRLVIYANDTQVLQLN